MEKDTVQLTQILKGWANLALDEFNLLPQEIKDMAEERFSICNVCPMRTNNTCSGKRKNEAVKDFYYHAKKEQRFEGQMYTGCGCNLSAKPTVVAAQCPLGKW